MHEDGKYFNEDIVNIFLTNTDNNMTYVENS